MLNNPRRKPFETELPIGKRKVIQLTPGDDVKMGDWYVVLGHLKEDWFLVDREYELREFHHAHVRILVD